MDGHRSAAGSCDVSREVADDIATAEERRDNRVGHGMLEEVPEDRIQGDEIMAANIARVRIHVLEVRRHTAFSALFARNPKSVEGIGYLIGGEHVRYDREAFAPDRDENVLEIDRSIRDDHNSPPR